MALSPLCRCPERAAPRGLALFSLHALFKGKFGSEPGSCAPVIFFLLLLLLLFFFFQHAARFISSSNSTLSSKPAYKSRFITYLPILLLLAELAAGSRLRALQALLRSFPSPSASPALPAFPRRKVPALLFPRFPGLAAGV